MENARLNRWGAPILLGISLLLWGAVYLSSSAIESLALQVAHPFEDFGLQTYHWECPLWLLTASWMGANTPQAYRLWSELMAGSAVVLTVFLAHRRWGPLWGRMVVVSPITYVLMTWVGLEDPFTVMVTALCLWGEAGWELALAGFLGAMNHQAAAIAGSFVIVLRMLMWKDYDGLPSWIAAWWPAGVVTGLVANMLIGPLDGTRLGYIWAHPLGYWLDMSAQQFPMFLYTAAFALWVPAVWVVWRYFAEAPRFYAAFLTAAVVSLGLTLFTLDSTRVFALLMWAPLLLALRKGEIISKYWGSGRDQLYRDALWATSWAGILVPRFCIGSGTVMCLYFLEVLR